MKRTNIHLREDQRQNMTVIAIVKNTMPAVEYREAVDNHIESNRALLKRGPKLKK